MIHIAFSEFETIPFTLATPVSATPYLSVPPNQPHKTTMVRIKHRYLLVQILYPDPFPKPHLPSSAASKPHTPSSAAPLPNVVRFHQPSPDDLTPQALARAIRDQIALLYGDYGVGMTASSLNGKSIRVL